VAAALAHRALARPCRGARAPGAGSKCSNVCTCSRGVPMPCRWPSTPSAMKSLIPGRRRPATATDSRSTCRGVCSTVPASDHCPASPRPIPATARDCVASLPCCFPSVRGTWRHLADRAARGIDVVRWTLTLFRCLGPPADRDRLSAQPRPHVVCEHLDLHPAFALGARCGRRSASPSGR
jgi:hypothetical protein